MCGCGLTKCRECWGRRLGLAARRYHFTPELMERLREAYRGPDRPALTRRLDALVRETGWPRWAFLDQAQRRGLVLDPRARWTAAEDELLREMLASQSLGAIMRTLGRSEVAIKSRAQHLRLSRRREGYDVADLAEVFGVHPHKAARWVERGLFVRPRGRLESGRIGEDLVARFIRHFPHEYDLRRVDQVWFKSMVFGRQT